ncbi:SMI1/KNR4 family protein [Kitasatospora sp. NPDC001683]
MRSDVARFMELAGMVAASGGGAVPWHLAPLAVGIEFPSDYREFVDQLGAGEIRGDLVIISPIPPFDLDDGNDGFSRMVARTSQDIGLEFKELRNLDFALCPYPIYPEPGGLLAWASNYSGDICFWLTEDSDPDRWPVVFWRRGSFPDGWGRRNMGMVQFLLAILSDTEGEISDLASSPSGRPVWVSDGGS